MKRMLTGFAVLALLVGSQSQAATKKEPPPPPDTYVVFRADGQFLSGYGLTGTVTIDTTTGEAVSAALAVVGPRYSEVAVFNGAASTGTNPAGEVTIVVGSGFSTGIQLVIPSTSLKAYAGGSLVGGESVEGAGIEYESAWWSPVDSFDVFGIDPLLYGSLEP
jgi:hypothetical protein